MNSNKISFLILIAVVSIASAQNGLYKEAAPLVLASEQMDAPFIKPDEVIAKEEGILKQVENKAAKLSKDLSHIDKLRILFNIFSLDGSIKGKGLPQHVLTEPYILPGAGLPKSSSLIGILQPKTVVGEAVLAARLSSPLAELDEIIKRREALRLLVNDKGFRERVRNIVESTAAAEESFLNYWDQEAQDLERDLKKAFYTLEDEKNPFNKWNPFSWPQKIGMMMNRWPQIMQIQRINSLFIQCQAFAGGVAAAAASIPAANGCLRYILRGQDDLLKILATYGLVCSVVTLPLSILGIKFVLWQYRLHRSILRSLHTRLKHVKAIGEAVGEIYEAAVEYPELAEGLSLIGNAQDFYINPEELSKNLPQLLNILSRNVFTKEKFGFFSHAGNVLAAHDYMLEVKSKYHKAYEIIGELSIMLAAAEMIVANPDKFCFPDVYQGDKPEFSATGLRNLLFGEKAIPYDVNLGGAKNTRIMLLTGPNGAGKSGLLVAATQAIACAQALGFAPASSLTMTPFNVIESFSNVKEDPSKRLSRFMAERQRSKDIMPRLRTLNQNQFAWLGVDEPNSGTTWDVADERSYRLYRNIAKYPNVLCIGTTHQEKPTILEEETNGIVRNFYPVVERDEASNGWIRRYKIVPGKPEWWFSTKEEFKKMRMQYTKKFY